MKTVIRLSWLFLCVCISAFRLHAQITAFSYNGRLSDNGVPSNGTYQIRFILYDAVTDGNPVAQAIYVTPVNVVNGLFTVTLDFGATVFTGAPRWLDVAVRRMDQPSLVTLTPRQGLTSSPYAIYANTAGTIAGGQIVKSVNGLSDAVKLEAGSNVSITPNGNSLVIAAAGGGGGVDGVWSLLNSNAFFNGGNVGIGTDNPAERLTIANVPSYNTGLKLTGNSAGGVGLALESTADSGHKYSLLSGASGTSVGAGGFAIYDDTVGAYRFAIRSSGKIGVGTPTPAAALEVHGEWDGNHGALTLVGQKPSLRFTGGLESDSQSWLIQVGADGPGNLGFYNKPKLVGLSPSDKTGKSTAAALNPVIIPVLDFIPMMSITPGGQVGIGTGEPTENLTIANVGGYDSGLKLTGNSAGGTGFALENTSPGGRKYALFSAGANDGVGAGGFGIYDEAAAAYRLTIRANGAIGIGKIKPESTLDVDGWVTATGLVINGNSTVNGDSTIKGTTTTSVLTITGGADLAEPFKMSEKIPQGAVVVIDEEHPGELKLSAAAYDTRVAGVVSGANGIHPGISLRQNGELDGGANVALSGRVYVQADASFGAIKPGDLLTTSEPPGHAMKVCDHAKAQGAVLGKAMSSLPEGKGLVLVLVTLQ